MTDLTSDFEDEDNEEQVTREEALLKRSELERRCKAANIHFEEMEGLEERDVAARISLQCGREKRWVNCWDPYDFQRLLSFPFEQYTFLSGLDAVCHYAEGKIEASVRPLSTPLSPRNAYSRVFQFPQSSFSNEWPTAKLTLTSPDPDNGTKLTLAPSTPMLGALVGNSSSNSLSLTVERAGISQHDQALGLLRKLSDSLFFQIDLSLDVPLSLARDRRSGARRLRKKRGDTGVSLQYPRAEYDPAPASLYWYARSAVGMPLLQFLAFYQVVEFYYPTYSQAEARRRLKVILKDPTFRGDRDADIGRVLSMIQVTRNGSFGDERAQLKATLNECVDPVALHAFIKSEPERMAFLSTKTKGLTEHKLPMEAPSHDLRGDVAERIYDIRCKIVHTKTDSRTGDLELLLPFSKEAEQLHHDIELVQYVAQQVMVSASTAM